MKNMTGENKTTPFRMAFGWLIRIIQGALVGLGGILPGISGGVLCVIFGIYKPIMECLSNPIKGIKRNFSLLLPVGIGIILGFFGLASVVDALLEKNTPLVVSVFVGLIFGMLPSLFKEAGKEGRTKGSYIGFTASFVIMFAFLLFIRQAHINITPNIWWFVFCGAIWGFSIIVPGTNSSSILMFLGLYKPMTEGISEFAPSVVFPIAAGGLATVLIFARAVNLLFEKKYSVTYHIILGAVISTTILIIPMNFSSFSDIALEILCIAAGFLFAFFLDRLSEKYKPQ